MGMIAASLLLFLNEEDTFWMMACIVQVEDNNVTQRVADQPASFSHGDDQQSQDLLPASYYSANLWGAQADQLVLRSLVNGALFITVRLSKSSSGLR